MTKALETYVRREAKKADVNALSSLLGDIVLKRRHKKAIDAINARVRDPFNRPAPATPSSVVSGATARAAARSVRRASRRSGRNVRYEVTTKWNDARRGTFRHYMLETIRRHTCSWDADADHAKCENPKFAKNRLDYSWAASNGYITIR